MLICTFNSSLSGLSSVNISRASADSFAANLICWVGNRAIGRGTCRSVLRGALCLVSMRSITQSNALSGAKSIVDDFSLWSLLFSSVCEFKSRQARKKKNSNHSKPSPGHRLTIHAIICQTSGLIWFTKVWAHISLDYNLSHRNHFYIVQQNATTQSYLHNITQFYA